MPKPTCSVDGCDKPIHHGDWCSMHHERKRRGSDFYAKGDLRSRERSLVPCCVEGCERMTKMQGKGCPGHQTRLHQTGSYGPPTFRDKDRRCTSGKYVRVFIPGHPLAHKDGYVYEHQLVVWEHGVDPRGKHVHHLNEDKHDNRWENLVVETNADHQSKHHRKPGTLQKNQYGEWPIRQNRTTAAGCGVG